MRKYFLIIFLAAIAAITILVSLSALSSETSIVTVDINTIKRINPLLMGHNTLGYDDCYAAKGQCVNNGKYSKHGAGQWNPSTNQPDLSLLKLARDNNVSALRFPGGCGTHHYDWKKAIGPLSSRPLYQFGIDEFLKLCETLNVTPIITLSYFTGTDNDLADLIEYLNKPAGGEKINGGIDWAEERAKNGHLQPYNVKYFEFGNEDWHGDHQNNTYVRPWKYASRYLKLRKLLKDISPNIQLGAVLKGVKGLDLEPWDVHIAETLRDSMDFGIIHIYPVGYQSNNGELKAEELFKIALSSPAQIKYQIEYLSKFLKEQAGRDIPLAITEYNGGFFQDKPVPYRHTLGNALLIADMNMVFIRSNAAILTANYWQFSNSYWSLVYNPDYMKDTKGVNYKRPNYFTFEIFAKHFGEYLIETDIKSQDYKTSGFMDVISSDYTINSSLLAAKKTVSPINITPDLWLNNPISGVNVKKDDNAVQLSFNTSEDINYFHTYYNCKINPDRKYRVIGKIKTENLISSSGVRLAVTDARGWKKTKWERATEEITGTNDWLPLSVDFTPLYNAEAIKISIRRLSSGKGAIKGKVWIKDVQLKDIRDAYRFPPTPYLSAISSTNEKKDKIFILILNKHLTNKLNTVVKANEFPISNIVRYWILNGPSIDSMNENKQETVKITDGELFINDGQGNFNIDLEPHSLTALELTKKRR